MLTTVLFSLTIAAFFAFFLYMWNSEGIRVYRSEQTRGYGVVTGVQTQLVSDGTAPHWCAQGLQLGSGAGSDQREQSAL